MKVQEILNFNPVDFQKGVNLFNFPILLSFMCLLVREEDFDLSGKSLSYGEVYMRMIRCLYKKFTIRTGIEYDESEFFEALKKIGELALKTLLSGEPLMQRREVFEKVGNDAFNYGLLIGHEDCFLLLKDITADIFVTFPHRSIQEFLGALFFVLMLSKGESVESLLGVHCSQPIFMMNPLFLHFCLWIVHFSPYFEVTDAAIAYEKLRTFVLSRIDLRQLHLAHTSAIYPALVFLQVPEMKDKVIVTFLKDLLANCKRTRHLVMTRYESIDWTLKALQRVLSEMTSIHVCSTLHHGYCTIPETLHNDYCLEVSLYGWSEMKGVYNNLLNAIAPCGKKISLTLVLDTIRKQEVDLSQFLHKDLKRLRIICKVLSRITVVKEAIPPCPSLTHLSLLGEALCYSVLPDLADSAGSGLLPKLRHLSSTFRHIGGATVPAWNTLTSLDWCNDPINFDRLPNLVSLSIPSEHIPLPCQSVFHRTFSQLTRLAVFDLTPEKNEMLMKTLGTGSFENLMSLTLSVNSTSGRPPVTWTSPPLQHLALIRFPFLPLWELSHFVLCELDISHSRVLSGNLSELFLPGFPSLHTLILSDCELILQDLCALIQSRVEGNLPKLRTLDVSLNPDLFAIMDSFEHEKPSEQCLYHMKPGQQFSDDLKSINYLQDLRISVYQSSMLFISNQWPRLEQLSIDCFGEKPTPVMMRTIAEAYEKNLLPSLQSILLFADRNQFSCLETIRLNKHGILVTMMKMEDKKFL